MNYTFDSVSAFADAAARPRNGGAAAALHADFASGLPTDWLIGAADPGHLTTLEALVKLVNEGWELGRDRLAGLLGSVTAPAPLDIRRRMEWADQGDEVCMERIYAGSLETAWRRTRNTGYATVQRMVTVVVDSMITTDQKADAAYWRGASAVVLANALVEAGYTVQMVSAFRGATPDGQQTACRVIVKPYHGAFDLSTVASAMALPGFFRGLGHAWAFGHLKLGTEVGAGGWLQEPVGFADLSDLCDGSALFVVGQTVNTEADARAWVAECVGDLDAAVGGGLGAE